MKTSFAFSTDFLLDDIHLIQRKKSEIAGAKAVLHVISVDTARPDAFAYELKAVS